MNFLSHYYLDRHITNDYFVVGVCTPDLLSIFDREVRIKSKKMHHMSGTTEFDFFQTGVERHFEADKIFHSSPFFTEECKHISVELQEMFGKNEIKRSFFVSHILLELMLDKVLIKRDSGLVDGFYYHFKQVGLHHVVEMTEQLAEREVSAYHSFLQRFLQNQYLYHYSEYEYITFVLRRLLRRVGVPEGTYLDEPAFVHFLAEYEERLAEKVITLFDYLRSNMIILQL